MRRGKMEKIEWKRLIALLLSAFDTLSESELSADESKPFSTPEGAFIQSSRKSFHRKILKNICGSMLCRGFVPLAAPPLSPEQRGQNT